MNRIADRGLPIADREMQTDARAVNGSPIRPVASRNSQPAIRNPQSVELHIEQLVLHGFAHADRHSIADAVGRELTRLFVEEGITASLAHSAEVDRINGGAFRVARGKDGETTGVQVARAIYGGLKG